MALYYGMGTTGLQYGSHWIEGWKPLDCGAETTGLWDGNHWVKTRCNAEREKHATG